MVNILFFLFSIHATHVKGATYDLGQTIVSADRIEGEYQKSSSSIEVFEQDAILRSSQANLTDFLKRQANVTVTQNGSAGSASSIYLRGAENRHTLLIIDGVEYSNPSNIGGQADWSQIPLASVKKIEILKGSQSVLYGSQAIGGVIKITTFEKESKTSKRVGFSYGSYSTYQTYADLSLPYKKWDFGINGQFSHTDGFSSFNSKRTTNADDDGYRLFSISPRLSLRFHPKHTVKIFSRIQATKTETDDYGADNKTSSSKINSQSYSILHIYKRSESFSLQNQASFLTNMRKESGYDYKSQKYDLESSFTKVFEKSHLLGGLEFESEIAKDLGLSQNINKHKDSRAIFYKQDYRMEEFIFDWGARYTSETIGGDQVTYRLGGNYHVSSIDGNLKAQVSTGFMGPSLYQTYSAYGSQNLKPETSTQYQIGWLQRFGRQSAELTFYQIDYDNLISFNNSTSKYQNETEVVVKGVELGSNLYLSRDFYSNLSFNLLRAYNKNTGQYLQQRPRQSFKFSLGWFVTETMELEFLSRYTGQRNDYNSVVLGGYTVFDLAYSYHLTQSWFLKFYFYNLFDRDYEQVYTYGTRGRSFKLALEGSF